MKILEDYFLMLMEMNMSTNPFQEFLEKYGNDPVKFVQEVIGVDPFDYQKELLQAGLSPNIMVDCSHGNSLKKHDLQPLVFDNCIKQILEGNNSIVSLMLESNLFEGNQKIPKDLSELKHGVSITDACISWDTAEKIVRDAHEQLSTSKALKKRSLNA